MRCVASHADSPLAYDPYFKSRAELCRRWRAAFFWENASRPECALCRPVATFGIGYACAGYDRTCGVFSSGRSRWRGVSAWAVLRADVSPPGRKRGVFVSVRPSMVCHLCAPIVHGSRRASYGQNLMWFGLNP